MTQTRRSITSRWRKPHRGALVLIVLLPLDLSGCERAQRPDTHVPALPDEPSPIFRNVTSLTAYAGDSSCASCHPREAKTYAKHSMAQSFHRFSPGARVQLPFDTTLYHAATGFSYSVVKDDSAWYQVEFLAGPDGKRLHELRKRMDYVMGSGHVGETFFTEENGRLFQLPLTWYRDHGWDFSPGYQLNNARFDRLMPDRCIACHSSYPVPTPFLEGKYAVLRPGIGCERCHGPGALHVSERRTVATHDSSFDNSIVNPSRLPLERRLDVCEQCHVHTAVSVLREGKDAFSYVPSQPLHDQWAFYRSSGSIDLVSHADRLRQSKCFIATRQSARPLECATCHDPHSAPPDSASRNTPCLTCHEATALSRQLAQSASLGKHGAGADCVSCHMPKVNERALPHGAFTEHWIRVNGGTPSSSAAVRQPTAAPIEAYYDRDRAGPEASLYEGLGEIVYASLANDGRVLGVATAALQRALEKDSTHAQAHFLLGVAYQQMGKNDDAIRQLELSVRIDSGRPDPLRALAQSYQRAGRPATEVVRLYTRALSAQPALAWLRAEYADFLQGEGRYDDAEREYRGALTEQPSLAVGWFNLGTTLAETGHVAASAEAFQEAVHLDPMIAQALAPLLQVRTSGKSVVAVSGGGPPLATLPVRRRAQDAFQLTIASSNRAAFLNVPPRGFVVILRPDGTLVRALPTGEGGALRWDLLTDAGNPIAGGLYRAQVQGRDAAGRPLPSDPLYFGVVRQAQP